MCQEDFQNLLKFCLSIEVSLNSYRKNEEAIERTGSVAKCEKISFWRACKNPVGLFIYEGHLETTQYI